MPTEAAVRDALQNVSHCAIVQACMSEARSARDLSSITGIPIVSCYRHLHHLASVGLLRIERSALSTTGKPFDLYRSTVFSARLDIDAGGIRTTWRGPSMGERMYGLFRDLEEH